MVCLCLSSMQPEDCDAAQFLMPRLVGWDEVLAAVDTV